MVEAAAGKVTEAPLRPFGATLNRNKCVIREREREKKMCSRFPWPEEVSAIHFFFSFRILELILTNAQEKKKNSSRFL